VNSTQGDTLSFVSMSQVKITCRPSLPVHHAAVKQWILEVGAIMEKLRKACVPD